MGATVTLRARASLLGVIVIAFAVIAAVAAPAFAERSADTAAPGDAEAGPLLAQAEDEDDEEEASESVGGTLSDAEGEPVPGVVITLRDEDGDEIGSVETGDDGTWEAILPGAGDYSAELDQETLPEGVELRNPDRATLEFTMRPGQDRTLLFPLGEDTRVVRGFTQRFLQALTNGVKFGVIIAMAAIGLSLIFGTTRLINFAHGEMVTFGAIVAFYFNATATGPRIHLALAALIAIAAGAALGFSLERGLWRPLRARRVGLFQMLIISIGLMFVIRHILVIFYGSRSRQYVGFAVQTPLEIGPIRITARDLTILVLSLVILLAVAAMLERTKLGKAMRAVADNRNLAESSGIDVQRVILLIWVMGGGLAAAGGVFLGTVENVSWLMGFRLLLLMFAGVILGGLGTAYGAMVGSLVVGIVTEVSVLWFSSELKLVWGLAALIIILLVRPQGILGIKERIG
jgi:neutral amino acid transport system permease protein